MCDIPLDFQRRFERRWAARFVTPIASAAPTSVDLKGIATKLPRRAKANEKHVQQGRLGSAGRSAHFLSVPTSPVSDGWGLPAGSEQPE
jgi:hypothetical protein